MFLFDIKSKPLKCFAFGIGILLLQEKACFRPIKYEISIKRFIDQFHFFFEIEMINDKIFTSSLNISISSLIVTLTLFFSLYIFYTQAVQKFFMISGAFGSNLTFSAKTFFYIFVFYGLTTPLFSPYQCLYDFGRLGFNFNFYILLFQLCRLVGRVKPRFVDGVPENIQIFEI